jgi:hypothetical protein
MLQDRLQPQTRMLVAAAFSLAIGFIAGLYALWSDRMEVIPPQPTDYDKTFCKSFQPKGKQYEFGGDYFTTEDRHDTLEPIPEAARRKANPLS